MNHINKVALTLSFIFPGFGQIWNRQYIKGINFILLQVIFIILVFYPYSNLFLIGTVAIPILWVWGMVDASRIHYYNYSSDNQRRHNMPLILGIIAFLILSEAILVSIALTIKRNDKAALEEKIYNESIQIPHDISDNNLSIDNEKALPADEYNPQYSQQISPPYPWVVTVKISERHSEISKLYHELRKDYQVQIIPVSSNPKHNAYAIIITGFETISDAEDIANKLRKDISNCFVAFYEDPTIPVK